MRSTWTKKTCSTKCFAHFELPADSPMAVEGIEAGMAMMESNKKAEFVKTPDGKSRGTMCAGGKAIWFGDV